MKAKLIGATLVALTMIWAAHSYMGGKHKSQQARPSHKQVVMHERHAERRSAERGIAGELKMKGRATASKTAARNALADPLRQPFLPQEFPGLYRKIQGIVVADDFSAQDFPINKAYVTRQDNRPHGKPVTAVIFRDLSNTCHLKVIVDDQKRVLNKPTVACR